MSDPINTADSSLVEGLQHDSAKFGNALAAIAASERAHITNKLLVVLIREVSQLRLELRSKE